MGRWKVRMVVGGAVAAVALMTLSPASGLVASNTGAKELTPNMSGAGFIDLRPGPNFKLRAPAGNGKAHHNFKLYCPPATDAKNHLRLHGNVNGNYQFTAEVITVTDCEDFDDDGRPDVVRADVAGFCNGLAATANGIEFTDGVTFSEPTAVTSSKKGDPMPHGSTPPPSPSEEDSVSYDLTGAAPECQVSVDGPIDGGSHKGHK